MFQLGTVSSQREAQMLIEGGDSVIVSPNGFKYHVIRNSTTVNVFIGGVIDVLIVGGGGGGGHGYSAGGGGAGGTVFVPSYQIGTGSYPAVIGEGGNGSPSQGAGPPYGGGSTQASSPGQNTTFLGFTAYGGGRGGSESVHAAGAGGSGGGAGAANQAAGAATQTAGTYTENNTTVVGYGNNGGTTDGSVYGGGGGGGASAAGTAGFGGAGIEYQAYALFRVAGGGRANYVQPGTGVDIWGGGSGGTTSPRIEGQAASSGTGSGGGGGQRAGGPFYSYWGQGGKGGSGLVIIKYPFITY